MLILLCLADTKIDKVAAMMSMINDISMILLIFMKETLIVLVAVPQGERHKQHKLMARWKGPFRITRAVSDHVYEVQHLIHREKLQEVHWSRLKFYCDDELEQIVKLRDVVRREDQEDSQVESIVQYKYDAESLTHQFRIHWTGFTNDDDTWEDARYILSLDRAIVDSFLSRLTTGSRKKEALLDYLDIRV